MKIYFCDVCNESIPLQDIKDGVATTIDGRIYCREHNPLRAFQDLGSKRSGDRMPVLMYGIVIVLLQAVRRLSRFAIGDGPIRTLTSVMKVTVLLNLFMLGSELFTALYTGGAHASAVK